MSCISLFGRCNSSLRNVVGFITFFLNGGKLIWQHGLMLQSAMIQRPLHWITKHTLPRSRWRTAHSLPLLIHAMSLSLMVVGNWATSLNILIEFLFLVNKWVTAFRTRIFSLRTVFSSFRLFSRYVFGYEFFEFRFLLGVIIRSLLTQNQVTLVLSLHNSRCWWLHLSMSLITMLIWT